MEILFEREIWGVYIGLIMLFGLIAILSSALCFGCFKSFLKKKWRHIIPACAYLLVLWLSGAMFVTTIVLGVYSEYTVIVTDRDIVAEQGYSIIEENGEYMKLGKFKNE